jgi:hypothetical protein
VARGGTHLLILSCTVEIDDIVTARSPRWRRYGSRTVSALVRGYEAAIACCEKVGGERLRTMYLTKCQLMVSS